MGKRRLVNQYIRVFGEFNRALKKNGIGAVGQLAPNNRGPAQIRAVNFAAIGQSNDFTALEVAIQRPLVECPA